MYNYYYYPCPGMYPRYRQQDRMYNRQRMYNPYLYNYNMVPDLKDHNRYPINPNYPYNQELIYSPWALRYPGERGFIEIKDYGPNPFVINIEEVTEQNDTYRTALWTGDHMPVSYTHLDVYKRQWQYHLNFVYMNLSPPGFPSCRPACPYRA